MARKKSYIRWAVVGEVGLYVGQYLTRKDAIADHIKARYGVASSWGRGLNTAQEIINDINAMLQDAFDLGFGAGSSVESET